MATSGHCGSTRDRRWSVAVKETVFIGQGEEHKLQFELQESKQLTVGETAKVVAALEAWIDLRKSLAREPRSRREELSAEQIAALKAALPKVVDSSAAGPLADNCRCRQARCHRPEEPGRGGRRARGRDRRPAAGRSQAHRPWWQVNCRRRPEGQGRRAALLGISRHARSKNRMGRSAISIFSCAAVRRRW